MYSKTLIARAVKLCYGSQAELARRIGVSRQYISRLQKDPRALSPEAAALIAFEVHEDPHHAMATVAIENADPDLSSRLQRAFHVPARASGEPAMSNSGDAGKVDRAEVTSTTSRHDIHWRGLYEVFRMRMSQPGVALRAALQGLRPGAPFRVSAPSGCCR